MEMKKYAIQDNRVPGVMWGSDEIRGMNREKRRYLRKRWQVFVLCGGVDDYKVV